MLFEIVWSDDSIDDRIKIATYLSEVAPLSVAQTVEDKIQDAAETIGAFPEMAAVWDEVTQTRRKRITGYDYSIYYTVNHDAEKINIYRVMHDKMQF